MINSKEKLVNKIKEMAHDLENRAEDIAIDWNKKIKRINFYADIEPENITEWDITKEYLVLPKRIDMKLNYNENKVDKMFSMGFEEVSLPAKITIGDREYYGWYIIERIDFNCKKSRIELKNEFFNKEYFFDLFNKANEFYVNGSKYYINDYGFNYSDDEDIYLEKLTFIEY